MSCCFASAFQVKNEDEGNLSEGIYPMLYTSDPAGISTDVSDPLATDELSDPVTYKCSSVKNDEISDDEEGCGFNDCSDGTSSKQLHQDSSDQSIEGEGAVHDNLRSSTETKDCVRDAIVSTSEKACSVQPNEIFIPLPDIQLPTANMLFHVKEENVDPLSEGNSPELYTSDSAGSDVSDPLATDDLSDPVTYKCSSVKEDQISDDEEGLHVHEDCAGGVSSKLVHEDSSNQPNTLTASQGEKVEALGRVDIVGDLDATLIGAKKELSPEENAQ
ncbi:uncharacterized protein LOC124170423 [Ischnura elegans]|uniref:uncharacterized protein LOC124170423 n=1 Tax=Ischnura elegans TaxID=197161 RepID=UPI001ED8AF18|nr:uncharacterized protein LOC124170423 [Ischnura elegans]